MNFAAANFALKAIDERRQAMAMIDRRRLLSASTGLLLGSGMAVSPVRAASHPSKAMPVINALGGLGNPNSRDGKRQAAFEPRTLADAHASGVTAINVTLGYVSGPDDPFESSVRDIGQWDAAIRAFPKDVKKVLSARDILTARDEQKIGLIYGFQNAAMIGSDIQRVEIFANLGVRVVQLTYNPANGLGDGSMASENRGITPFGREVIGALNAQNLMVDLSHSGQQTCLDAARASTRPISINHTGCRALVDLPRNKTDEELRLVASRGGFVGIYFMPFLNLSGHAMAQDVVSHIDHAVNICGEDHVGIGTDGDITPIDDLTAYQTRLAEEIAERRAAGISAQGERPDTYPFVVDLRGPDQFRKLQALLRSRGYSTGRIEKVLGGNFLRFAEDVWRG